MAVRSPQFTMSSSSKIIRSALRSHAPSSVSTLSTVQNRSNVAFRNFYCTSITHRTISFARPPSWSIRFFSSKENGSGGKNESEDKSHDESNDESQTPLNDDSHPEKPVEETLQLQVKDLKDQLLRSLAEQENTRRIAKRDVNSAKSFAVSSFAKSLLDTSDNLSRAMDAVNTEELEGNPVLKTLYEGIQMTASGLDKSFQKHGLKKFGVVGETFDPNKHEALFEYMDEKSKAGTVGQVMKAGFELNGRVIRSAEVGVIKKS